MRRHGELLCFHLGPHWFTRHVSHKFWWNVKRNEFGISAFTAVENSFVEKKVFLEQLYFKPNLNKIDVQTSFDLCEKQPYVFA